MQEVIGILGGSFDPVHIGHLVLAACAREQLKVDRFLFMPNSRSPLKGNGPFAAFRHRVAMLALAIGGTPGFEVSEIEGRRSGASYTIDTLREIRKTSPDSRLFLVLGEDALSEFHLWKSHDDVQRLAELAVVARAGGTLGAPMVPVNKLQMPAIDISSTMIRERLRRNANIDFLVPPSVSRYIQSHKLYRG